MSKHTILLSYHFVTMVLREQVTPFLAINYLHEQFADLKPLSPIRRQDIQEEFTQEVTGV